jgi:hypothetical protein
MDWSLYWTILAQAAIAFPLFLGCGLLIRLFWFPPRKHEVSEEELQAVAEDVLDRIVIIGRDSSGNGS